ncbi:hypothetical protein J1N35_000296 [Gossypium stocksii]|uniref:Uncharacterized protein n=4 Tax=Gossypium TaxID=3633 RepID=A0A9D3WI55_9ROSI|nr:hypothetical protein J1N35_000296 [Gossypium stocksii]
MAKCSNVFKGVNCDESFMIDLSSLILGMGTDSLLLPTVGPPIKPRAGLRRKQAGRGSYRGS